MKFLLLRLIKLYQSILSGKWSFFNSNCKFYPSCSEYSYKSIEKFGIFRGLRMSIWRILKCNPWSKGGIDDLS